MNAIKHGGWFPGQQAYEGLIAGGYFFPKPSPTVFERGCLPRWAFQHVADTNRKQARLLTTFSFTQLSVPVPRSRFWGIPSSEPHERRQGDEEGQSGSGNPIPFPRQFPPPVPLVTAA